MLLNYKVLFKVVSKLFRFFGTIFANHFYFVFCAKELAEMYTCWNVIHILEVVEMFINVKIFNVLRVSFN